MRSAYEMSKCRKNLSVEKKDTKPFKTEDIMNTTHPRTTQVWFSLLQEHTYFMAMLHKANVNISAWLWELTSSACSSQKRYQNRDQGRCCWGGEERAAQQSVVFCWLGQQNNKIMHQIPTMTKISSQPLMKVVLEFLSKRQKPCYPQAYSPDHILWYGAAPSLLWVRLKEKYFEIAFVTMCWFSLLPFNNLYTAALSAPTLKQGPSQPYRNNLIDAYVVWPHQRQNNQLGFLITQTDWHQERSLLPELWLWLTEIVVSFIYLQVPKLPSWRQFSSMYSSQSLCITMTAEDNCKY